MPKFMLLSYVPAEGGPTPGDYKDPQARKEAQARWKAFDQALKEAGAYVAHHAVTKEAKTVRATGGDTQITDGPFADTKEFFAGCYVIEAADMDDALKWAAQMPTSEYGPVEVRPVYS